MANQLIHFGKLSLLYESGFIRYIRAGEIEIVRMIYFALRDSTWATADLVRNDERLSVTTNGFDISYTATNTVNGRDVFRWQVRIHGNNTGELQFSVDGIALADFTRNRAGICVLHPIRETKEKALRITKPDGSVYESKFPTAISPHQPFLDITKMAWDLGHDVWAELQFDGDVFETEDQRNWSDTSFKTYSTPLSRPYPVTLKPGDTVRQKVIFRLINPDTLPSSDTPDDIEITIDQGTVSPFPKIGFNFPGAAVGAKGEIALLKQLDPDHLRIELDLSSKEWITKWNNGIVEARSISTKVFVHLVLADSHQFEEFVASLSETGIEWISILAISPLDRKANAGELIRVVVPKARKLFPGISIGGGYISYFTELNRNRFDYSLLDFVIYPVSPQAHATDSRTLIDNLPAQTDAAICAKNIATGKEVYVGKVSLKPSGCDERQITALAAGWMLASIKYLAEGMANVITMFDSHGPGGYFMDEHDIFPVYHALLLLTELKPRRVIKSTCNEPLIISSLIIESENSMKHVILINHTDSKRSVAIGEQRQMLRDYEIRVIPLLK